MNEIDKVIKKLHKNSLIMENSQYKSELDNIKEKMHDKNFKLAIVGEFSSGKSTFINSLLGKDILKHATVETTATITNIHNIDASKKSKILVNYSNGKSIKYENFDSLKDCTTTDSEEDVAANIESVDIYMHFMDTTENIIIVDTPGLNGIADNHREKTIEEIKRSHACIYLFQKNGVTDSDRDFIKLLFKYQNNFIFVLNFIDELRKSEGETIVDKIKTIEDEIEKIIKSAGDDSIKIQYDVYGISALKALAAKDENIKRLYENDVFDLTDERREKILKESNIKNVENKISYLIKNNGKSKEELAYYSLCLLLEEIIIKEKQIKDLNESLMEQDDTYKNKEQALKLRNEITDKENLIIEKLTNLVDAEFIRGKKLLNKDIDENISKIYNNISKAIFREATLENFEKKCKDAFFVKELKEKINLYKDVIEENQRYVTQNIYKSMLKRLNEYSKYSSKKIKKLDDIKLVDVDTNNIGIDWNPKSKEIENNKKDLYDNCSIKAIAEEKIKIAIENLDDANVKCKIVKEKEKSLPNRKNLEENRLGKKPNREVIGYDYVERQVEREGFFGGIANFFAGPKIVTKSIPIYNDNDIAEWNRKKSNLDLKFKNEKEFLFKELEKLEKRKSAYSKTLDENKMNLDNSDRKIKFLKVQIKAKESELKEYQEKAKSEYLNALKQQVNESIGNYLVNSKNFNKTSVKKVLKDNVEQNISINKKKIEKEVQIQCKDYIKAEIERLDTLIHGDIDELKAKYKVKKHLILQLEEIYKDLKEENHE